MIIFCANHGSDPNQDPDFRYKFESGRIMIHKTALRN